jgi:hypothetical protein
MKYCPSAWWFWSGIKALVARLGTFEHGEGVQEGVKQALLPGDASWCAKTFLLRYIEG